jgi:hypothetical protein
VEEDLSCRAKQSRYRFECLLQMLKKSGRHSHVIVEQADVRVPGRANSAVYRGRKTHRLVVAQHDDSWKTAMQEFSRAIIRTVIHHDDFAIAELVHHSRQHTFQQISSVPGRDHHGNPRRPVRRRNSHRRDQTGWLFPQKLHDESEGVRPKRAEA